MTDHHNMVQIPSKLDSFLHNSCTPTDGKFLTMNAVDLMFEEIKGTLCKPLVRLHNNLDCIHIAIPLPCTHWSHSGVCALYQVTGIEIVTTLFGLRLASACMEEFMSRLETSSCMLLGVRVPVSLLRPSAGDSPAYKKPVEDWLSAIREDINHWWCAPHTLWRFLATQQHPQRMHAGSR